MVDIIYCIDSDKDSADSKKILVFFLFFTKIIRFLLIYFEV